MNKIEEYEFSLKFSLSAPSDDPNLYVEALGEAGCTDAVIGVGELGFIGFAFSREGNSAVEAITSAVEDVKNTIPSAMLISATPDLVGLTDIANIFSFSRQYARDLRRKNIRSFPYPVHEGNPSLWHLSSILRWSTRYLDQPKINSQLLEVAEATRRLNLSREQFKFDKQGPSPFDSLFEGEQGAPSKG